MNRFFLSQERTFCGSEMNDINSLNALIEKAGSMHLNCPAAKKHPILYTTLSDLQCPLTTEQENAILKENKIEVTLLFFQATITVK